VAHAPLDCSAAVLYTGSGGAESARTAGPGPCPPNQPAAGRHLSPDSEGCSGMDLPEEDHCALARRLVEDANGEEQLVYIDYASGPLMYVYIESGKVTKVQTMVTLYTASQAQSGQMPKPN
jgi:hypothetical protein